MAKQNISGRFTADNASQLLPRWISDVSLFSDSFIASSECSSSSFIGDTAELVGLAAASTSNSKVLITTRGTASTSTAATASNSNYDNNVNANHDVDSYWSFSDSF